MNRTAKIIIGVLAVLVVALSVFIVWAAGVGRSDTGRFQEVGGYG